mmetsp:Transcript_13706/g.28311  ORF Transcript_13706/g.28311 Transcript_13706/m.28311 type:complete len:80 (+) Transcript_13706:166-405(+)
MRSHVKSIVEKWLGDRGVLINGSDGGQYFWTWPCFFALLENESSNSWLGQFTFIFVEHLFISGQESSLLNSSLCALHSS